MLITPPVTRRPRRMEGPNPVVEPSTINKTAPPVAETALLPQKRVAVCISGLPLRLLTASLIHNMVAPNVPAWSFDIVYALSADRLPYFHKSGAGAQPTPLGILPQTELAKALLKLGADSAAPHRVHILDPVPALNISEWRDDLGLPSAARLNIVDHEEANQHRVLNMWAHQVHSQCVTNRVLGPHRLKGQHGSG